MTDPDVEETEEKKRKEGNDTYLLLTQPELFYNVEEEQKSLLEATRLPVP